MSKSDKLPHVAQDGEVFRWASAFRILTDDPRIIRVNCFPVLVDKTLNIRISFVWERRDAPRHVYTNPYQRDFGKTF